MAELGTRHNPLGADPTQAEAVHTLWSAPPPTPAPSAPAQPVEDIASLGRLAEQALIEAARERRPLSWRALCAKMCREDLAVADRRRRSEILTAADHRPANPPRPLLSALVIDPAGTSSDRFFRIATDHGRTVPPDPRSGKQFRQREIEKIYLRWLPATPPSARPARSRGDRPPTAGPRGAS